MQGYTHNGPVNCIEPFDVDLLKGKTAIVTGGMATDSCSFFQNTHKKIGANGLGEAYVRALVTAGYVSRMT
jgi:hypothetical protein